MAGSRLPLRQGRQRGALLLQLLGLRGQRPQHHAQLLHPAQAAHAVAPPLHLAFCATAWHGTHLLGRRAGQGARLGGLHHCARQRVFAATLHAGQVGQGQRLVHARGGHPGR